MLNLAQPTPWHAPAVKALQVNAGRFKSLRNMGDLAALFETSTNNLQLIRSKPEYHTYEIPKKDGSTRLIEDPNDALKTILQWLNHYLQAVYYFQRPAAVYGFCISCRDEDGRNVISNAKQHLGNPYVLVMDLHDFFHTVTIARVYQTFSTQFPVFDDKLIDTLTCISTYKDRLPMGSPASPVISNLAVLDMDAEMETFCKAASVKYTRYADDMVFSAKQPISENDVQTLRGIITNSGLIVNEKKVRRYGPGENACITGLLLTENGVDLPDGYLVQLEEEINRFKTVMMVDYRYRTGMSYQKLKLFKQEVQGKINFAQMALGSANNKIIKLHQLFADAEMPPDSFQSAEWLDIPYL